MRQRPIQVTIQHGHVNWPEGEEISYPLHQVPDKEPTIHAEPYQQPWECLTSPTTCTMCRRKHVRQQFKEKWPAKGDKAGKRKCPLPKDLTPSEIAVMKFSMANKSKKSKRSKCATYDIKKCTVIKPRTINPASQWSANHPDPRTIDSVPRNNLGVFLSL